MRWKNRSLNQILQRCMIGIGTLLVVLLLGQMVKPVSIKQMGDMVSEEVGKKAADLSAIIWKHSYPARMSYVETDMAKRIPWYHRMVWERIPIYRYVTTQKQELHLLCDIDPAYQSYQENRTFYLEHGYLFQYGIEDSNQQEMPQELVQEKVPEPASEADLGNVTDFPASSTPAHTAKADMAVIGTQYVKAQLADYDFLMKHFYNVHSATTAGRQLMDVEKFLEKDFSLSNSNESPQILIYHTHSQETYVDYGADNQGATVVGVGNYLTELLQAKGYHVLHDTSVYDLKDGKLDRNKAYNYALEGITSVLQKNPSIEVVLDVHRDGVREGLHLVSEVNGKQTAPIMFFNGLSRTPSETIEYLPNPYLEDNLSFSFQMQVNAAAYYPGLTRKIYLKGLRYNLHLRPRSALIEVGAQTNTYGEARNAMEPLSELLDMILQEN